MMMFKGNFTDLLIEWNKLLDFHDKQLEDVSKADRKQEEFRFSAHSLFFEGLVHAQESDGSHTYSQIVWKQLTSKKTFWSGTAWKSFFDCDDPLHSTAGKRALQSIREICKALFSLLGGSNHIDLFQNTLRIFDIGRRLEFRDVSTANGTREWRDNK